MLIASGLPWADVNPALFWAIALPVLVLFACAVSALIEWRLMAYIEDVLQGDPIANGNGRAPARASAADLQAFWPQARSLGFDSGQVLAMAGRPVPDLTKAELDELLVKLKASVAGCASAAVA